MNYRKRRTIFDKTESEWRAHDDALVARDTKGAETHFPWRDLVAVRIAYAPTRFKHWRHTFVLEFRGRKKLEIDNVHFAGIADFQNRSDTYVPFVRAALEKIRRAKPDMRVQVGAKPLVYTLTTLFVLAAFAFLAVVVLLLPVPLDAWPATILLRLALIALMLPTLFRWLKRARPRSTTLDAIPQDALPELSG